MSVYSVLFVSFFHSSWLLFSSHILPQSRH